MIASFFLDTRPNTKKNSMKHKPLLLLLMSLIWSSSYCAKTIECDDQSYKVPKQKIITQRDKLCKKFDKDGTLSWTELSLYYTCKTLLNGTINRQKRKLLEQTFSSLTCPQKISLPRDKRFLKADECEYKALKERFQCLDKHALNSHPETHVSVCLLAACLEAPKSSPEYFWLKDIYNNLTFLIPTSCNDDEALFQFDQDEEA